MEPVAVPAAPTPAAETIAVADSQLAGRGARLLAIVIDGVIGGVIGGIAGGIGAGAGALAAASEETDLTWLVVLAGLFGLVLGLAYLAIQVWMLVQSGQTIGKKMMGVRIVQRNTGRNGGFVPNVLLRGVVSAILGAVPFYSLVDPLMIFRDDRRCIHDMLAGTVVIKN